MGVPERNDSGVANTVGGNGPNLNRVRVVGLAFWSAIVVWQSLWWFQEQGVASAGLVVVGGILGINVFLRRKVLAAYPLSSSMMLGFTSYYFVLPPIVTLLEGKPLTNNLDNPILVFLHAVICLLCLVSAHAIYRRWNLLQKLRWFVAERIYRPFGFFRSPSNLHLLAMGGVGLLAIGVQVFIAGAAQRDVLGVGNKFMQALYPLVYLPFCMIVRAAMGDDNRTGRNWLFILAGYSVLLVMLSVGRNSRAAFLAGAMSVGLVYIYGSLVGLFRAHVLRVRTLLVAIVGFALVAGPISDLAVSMVIVRGSRAEISASELILETIQTFQDKLAIQERLLSDLETRAGWDERYVDSLFMSRLANLKYADNSITLASGMGDGQRSYVRELEFQRVLSVFPRPLIEGLGLPVDKDFVGAASGGDLMLYAATGNRYVLGGFRTGSIFGSGYALFQWWYPLLMVLPGLVIFALADSLTTRGISRSESGWVPVFSPMAIIGFFTWFFYLTSAATGTDSFSGLAQYILRGWMQVLVVYVFAYTSTYAMLRPFVRLLR